MSWKPIMAISGMVRVYGEEAAEEVMSLWVP